MKKPLSFIISILTILTILLFNCIVAYANDTNNDASTEDKITFDESIDRSLDDVDNSNDTESQNVSDNTQNEEEISKDDDITEDEEVKPTPTDIRLSRVKINYSGTVQRPRITVYYKGQALIYNEDFKVNFSDWNSTYPGKYKVFIEFIGNYSGSAEREYTILQRNDLKIKLSSKTFTINGKVQRPLITVTDTHGHKLTYKKDFTVNYSNWSSKNVGRYTVTVNLIDKKPCSFTYPYYINPKKMTFVNSANGGFRSTINGFSLKWYKNTNQTSGYEVQYATNRNFSNKASIIIDNLNQTSVTLTKRAPGKRYYVRIRAFTKIGNGTFYSDWDYKGNYLKSVVTIEPHNSKQEKIINIAQNYNRYGIVAKDGYCEGWVADVYEEAFGKGERIHCAVCAGRKWGVSRDWSEIQVGAAVYGYSHNPYGHVGIYIGAGRVMHNLNATVRIDSLETWVKNYNGACWGWEDGNNLSGNSKYNSVGHLM